MERKREKREKNTISISLPCRMSAYARILHHHGKCKTKTKKSFIIEFPKKSLKRLLEDTFRRRSISRIKPIEFDLSIYLDLTERHTFES